MNTNTIRIKMKTANAGRKLADETVMVPLHGTAVAEASRLHLLGVQAREKNLRKKARRFESGVRHGIAEEAAEVGIATSTTERLYEGFDLVGYVFVAAFHDDYSTQMENPNLVHGIAEFYADLWWAVEDWCAAKALRDQEPHLSPLIDALRIAQTAVYVRGLVADVTVHEHRRMEGKRAVAFFEEAGANRGDAVGLRPTRQVPYRHTENR